MVDQERGVDGQPALRAAEAIRAARAALNRAIVAKDANAIAALLADEYHIITALNSQRFGREESRRSWETMFADDPNATFERTPSRIDVNDELGMAHETGDWSGVFTAGSVPVSVGGIYSAKWQRAGSGQWLLLAEIYTPLRRA